MVVAITCAAGSLTSAGLRLSVEVFQTSAGAATELVGRQPLNPQPLREMAR